jgi:hypothetical protein
LEGGRCAFLRGNFYCKEEDIWREWRFEVNGFGDLDWIG